MPPRYPWDAIRLAYTHGTTDDRGHTTYPTLDQVAATHGVRGDHVRRRAGRERWGELREAAQAELERQRREARSAEYVASADRVDGHSVRVAEQGLQLIGARIQELVTFEGQRLQALQAGNVPQGEPLQAGELTALSLAGIRFHQLAMRAVGMEGQRAGLAGRDPGAGDVDDLAAVVITTRERELAATVGRRVRDAIDVASVDARAPGPEVRADSPVAPADARAPVAPRILDSLVRANGSNGHT